MPTTCGAPCRCNCLDVEIYDISIGDYTTCTANLDECSYANDTAGSPRPFLPWTRLTLRGPGNVGDVCNCTYTLGAPGEAPPRGLCLNGDMAEGFMLFDSFEITLYGGSYFQIEVGFNGWIFKGAGITGSACEVVCYNKTYPVEYPLVDAVYTAEVREAVDVTEIMVASGSDPITSAMSISLTVNSVLDAHGNHRSEYCVGACELSQRVIVGGGMGGGNLVTISGSRGRCPTVESAGPPADQLKDPGIQCKETDAFDNCDGVEQAARHENIVHKHYFPYQNPASLGCTVDCGDLFGTASHASPGSNPPCSAFEDPGAWWTPPLADGWTTEAKEACMLASRQGGTVWRLKVDCTWWYKWYEEGTSPVESDLELCIEPPCGTSSTCLFYATSGCCGTWPDEEDVIPHSELCAPPGMCIDLINAPTYPGEVWAAETEYDAGWKIMTSGCDLAHGEYGIIQKVVTPGTSGASTPIWPTEPGETTVDGTVTWESFSMECLGIKVIRYRVKTETWGDPPADNYVCIAEEYKEIAASCVSPYAPDFDLEIYECPACADCYDEDGTALEGYVPGNIYTEKYYGADRDAAVDAVLVRIAEVEALVAANYDIVPLPCCASTWHSCYPGCSIPSKPNNWHWWQDKDHTKLCDTGVLYGSVQVSSDEGHEGDWEAQAYFCCRCLGDHVCCTPDHHMRTFAHWTEWYDSRYVDFWGNSSDVCVSSTPSVADDDGNYCRDLTTAYALYSQWTPYVNSMFGRECWEWLGFWGGNDGPWRCTSTYSITGCMSYSDPAPTTHCAMGAWNAYATYTNHDAAHMGALVPDYSAASCSIPYTVDNDRLGCVNLTCADSGGVMTWSGYVRKCMWCDQVCDEDHGCASNPCLRQIRSSYGGGYGYRGVPCWGYSFPYGCTDAKESQCAEWVQDRLSISEDGSTRAWVSLCQESLDSYFALVGCGVEFCADKCGMDWMLTAPWDENRNMAQYCYGNGDVPESPPPTEAGAAAAVAMMYASVASSCASTVAGRPTWVACEDCATVAASSVATWSACSGPMVQQPVMIDISEYGGVWYKYEMYSAYLTQICPGTLSPAISYYGTKYSSGPSAGGPWTLISISGWWYGYNDTWVCMRDPAWQVTGDGYGYTLCG